MIRMLTLSAALLGLGLLGAPARSAPTAVPVLRAWSDANALPPVGETRRALEREGILGCWVPGPTASRDRLKRFDAALARLPQDSPERAAYQAVRPSLAQYAEEERKAPASVTPAPKDLADALKRAEAWLDRNEPAGMKAFRASPEAKDALKASQAALEASLLGQQSAALAALIAAHRLAPKNAEVLVNLAGALSHFRLNDEALVVLAAAEKLPLGEGALGWSVKATLLNNRGYALIGLGRFADAETALRAASKLTPNLAEAQQNLARALACQGKVDEALVAARRGARRTAAETAAPGTPTPPEAFVETPQPDEEEGDEPRETHRPAEYVFDVSRGKKFNLPNLKLPATPAEAVKLLPSYKKLLDELRARDDAMSDRQQELEELIRARQEPNDLVTQRRRLLQMAIYKAADAPRIKPLWRSANKARDEVSELWTNFWHCEGGCTIDEIMQKASASRNYKQTMRDLCVPALQYANNSWRGALHGYATELAKAAEATYRLETGLAANYSDAAWHELASLQAEKGALGAYSNLVHLAMIWAQDVEKFEDSCVQGASAPDVQQVAEEIKFDRTASCKDLFGTATLKASFKVVEISVGCETVALKAATPGWIGAFGKVEKNFANGNVTISAGAEAGANVPFTSSGVKASMGMYVTLDGDGNCKDVGTLAEASATVGLKVDDGKSGVGAKLNGKWSLLPSVGSP